MFTSKSVLSFVIRIMFFKCWGLKVGPGWMMLLVHVMVAWMMDKISVVSCKNIVVLLQNFNLNLRILIVWIFEKWLVGFTRKKCHEQFSGTNENGIYLCLGTFSMMHAFENLDTSNIKSHLLFYFFRDLSRWLRIPIYGVLN